MTNRPYHFTAFDFNLKQIGVHQLAQDHFNGSKTKPELDLLTQIQSTELQRANLNPAHLRPIKPNLEVLFGMIWKKIREKKKKKKLVERNLGGHSKKIFLKIVILILSRV